MKLEILDDTSFTDEETNLGDEYEVEAVVLAKKVRFGFVQTHKIGRGIDPPSSEASFIDSSDCELASNVLFSVDDYEMERKLVLEKAQRNNTRAAIKASNRTEQPENKLPLERSKVQILSPRNQNKGSYMERMTNRPSTEWLEEHRNQCYPPSPNSSFRPIIQKGATARVLDTSSKAESGYRVVTVDDHSFEFYSPSPSGHSKPKVGKRMGLLLKGKKVPLIL